MFFHNHLRNKLLGKISTRIRAESIQDPPEQRENVEGGGLGLEVGGSSETAEPPKVQNSLRTRRKEKNSSPAIATHSINTIDLKNTDLEARFKC